MDTYFPPPLATALVASVPAALVWWSGRELARTPDDPALPERLMSASRRHGVVMAVAIASIAVLWTRHLAWAVPAMFAAASAAAYPMRKALYCETWSFSTYLAFTARLFVSLFGFWVLVIVAPVLALAAGAGGWVVSAALAAALFVWQSRYVDAVRRILDARPIDDPALSAAFARMAEECRLSTSPTPPLLEQVHIPGGVLANAVALASLRRSAVLVTSTLMERLTPEEREAICAHEVAHLEHFNAPRLRREGLFSASMIVGGALIPALSRLGPPFVVQVIPLAWLGVVVVALGLRAKARQAHETASDLRAVALTGNPGALVSALTKLHAIARVPRRWDTEFERHSTHPSLARRIQAIRSAAGGAPAALGSAAIFAGVGGAGSATFDDGHLTWTEGAQATHSISYDGLVELRVDVSRAGAPLLVVVDKTQRRWEVPLEGHDVARAQAVLDIVDARLATAAAPDSTRPIVRRLTPAVVALAALGLGQWGALVVAILCTVTPVSNLLAASGAAALMAAALTWRDHLPMPLNPQPFLAATLLVFAPVLLWMAFKARDEVRSKKAVGVLSTVLGLVCALALFSGVGLDVLGVNHTVRTWHGLSVLPIAIAVAVAWRRSGVVVYGAALLMAAGAAAGVAGSAMFLDRFGGDPFLLSAPPMRLRPIVADAVGEVIVPEGTSQVRLSRDGRFAAFTTVSDRGDARVHVGPVYGPWTAFDADEAVFVGDARALVLEGQRGEAGVQEVSLRDKVAVVRRHRLPQVTSASVVENADGSAWRLVGRSANEEIVGIDIDGKTGAVKEQRWPLAGDAEFFTPLGLQGSQALVLEARYGTSAPPLNTLWWLRLTPLMPAALGAESHFFSTGPDGRRDIVASRLSVRCPGAMLDERAVCAAFDGMRTRFITVGAQDPAVAAVVTAPGHFIEHGEARGGWISGWWQGSPVALRLATGEAFHVERREVDDAVPFQLAPADKMIGALSYRARQPVLRLYGLP